MIDLEKELQNTFTVYETGVELKVPAQLTYYRGHFPQNPILPAVGILDISIYFINYIFYKSDLYRQPLEINQLKVVETVTPNHIFHIDIQQTDQLYHVTWKSQNKPVVELYLKF